MSVQVISVNGHGQWIVDSGSAYEPTMYLRPWLHLDPSCYYYLLTTPWPGAPHWLLTGVLMSNFGRMSFGGSFLAGGPTHVRTVLTG